MQRTALSKPRRDKRRGDDLQLAGNDGRIQQRLHLRRNPEPMRIPEGTQPTHNPAPFVKGKIPPYIPPLQADGIQNAMPAHATGLRRSQSRANPP
ncbi:hypothetical protein D3C86_2034210 [compost metagenome]